MRITTTAMTVFVLAGVILPALIHSSNGTTRIGLVGPRAQALEPSLLATARAAKVRVKAQSIADEAAARSEVKAGRLDVARVVSSDEAVAIVTHTLSSADRTLLAPTISSAHERAVLSGAGVSAATIEAARTLSRSARWQSNLRRRTRRRARWRRSPQGWLCI